MTTDERYPPPEVPASEIAEALAARLPFPQIDYPESDGQPMGETEAHRDEIVNLISALKDFLRDEPDVYVGGNLFIYYEMGNPKAVVAPDVFVIRGVPKLIAAGGRSTKRRTYKLWEEGRAPSMVIEVSSEHTQDEDTGQKKARYAQLGVEEYFLFDPFGEYLDPRLQGFRLAAGRYRPIRRRADGSLVSRTVGVGLAEEDDHLRLRVAATGEPLLRVDELQNEHRRQAAARRQAEQRVAALEAELAQRLRELERQEQDV